MDKLEFNTNIKQRGEEEERYSPRPIPESLDEILNSKGEDNRNEDCRKRKRYSIFAGQCVHNSTKVFE